MLAKLKQQRNFWLLWIGMLFSMMAGNFLLVTLSLQTYMETGSASAASIFFVAQFAAPVLFSGLTELLCRRLPPKRAMLLADCVSMISVIAIGLINALSATFVLLLLRGFADSLLKSSRVIAIKVTFSDEALPRANALLAGPHFIGNGLGVLLASALLERVGIFEIGLITAGLLAVALCAYGALSLPAVAPESGNTSLKLKGRIVSALSGKPALQLAMVQLVTITIFLQGIHQVARTVVPVDSFNLDATQAGFFQISAVLGIICATFLVAQVRWIRVSLDVTTITLISCLALVFLWVQPNPILGAATYFVFMCAFEIGYIRAQNTLILTAEPAALATLMVLKHVGTFSGMAILILVAGAMTDQIGGLSTSVLTSVTVASIMIAAKLIFGKLMTLAHNSDAK